MTAEANDTGVESVGRRMTETGLLASDLWLDQPDALGQIDARLEAGEISCEQADQFRQFVDRGYLVISIDVHESLCKDLDAQVERLWRDRPADVAYAYHSGLKRFSESDEAAERRASYRIADLHSYSATALDLYLHPKVHEYVRLIFGQRAVATQSLYFEFGSAQALHRDPVHVYMQPASHLVAAWIALEDIDPTSGPLEYVPGSHRLPYYEVEPGEYRYNHATHTDEVAEAMAAFDVEQCTKLGLEKETFLPRRGEVLIWHHSLLHGGAHPRDLLRTRKSFVIHFTTMQEHESVTQVVHSDRDVTGTPPLCSFESVEVLGRDRSYGFASPLRSDPGHLWRRDGY